MTNLRSTKSALLTSALALLLCFAMLLGTTFAWFTDSVTSAGNIIQSGTLRIAMQWKDATSTGAQQTYKNAAEGPIFNYTKWEPGYVEAKNVQIGNNGTLALKYQLAIAANGTVSKLADAIDVYYADGEITLADRTMAGLNKIGTLTEVLANMSTTASGRLDAGEAHTVTIALKMRDTATNEYQDLAIGSSFSVKCFATQLTSEFDSFGDQYDALATIDTEAELLEALAGDFDCIALGSNVTITDTVEIPEGKTVAIDLMGYTMSQVNGQQTTGYAMILNKGDLTIEDSIGVGKISYTDTTPYTADPGWASNTIRNEGTLTVNGGTVENLTPEEVMNFGYPHAIDVYQGSVTTINGGTVKSLNYDSIRMFCNSTTEATKVVINGGTIVNRVSFQDPNSTNPGYGILEINGGNFITMNGVNANVRLLNFCANCSNMKATVTGGSFDKGFKTQDLASAGITTSDWLTYAGADEVVTNATELENAIANAQDGDVIALGSNVEAEIEADQKSDTRVVIDGKGNVFKGSITVDGQSAAISSAGLVIRNVVFDSSENTYDACIRLGASGNNNTRYTSNVTIENCTFIGDGSDTKVAIKSYTGGDKNLTVVGCTATDMHSLLQIANAENLTVKDCTVTGKRGMSVGASSNVQIINTTINATSYGIRSEGRDTDSSLTITDCKITAYIPVVVRKVSNAYTLTFNGSNTMTETNSEGLWCAVATNEYGDVDKAGLTPVTATVTVTMNDASLDANGLFVKE